MTLSPASSLITAEAATIVTAEVGPVAAEALWAALAAAEAEYEEYASVQREELARARQRKSEYREGTRWWDRAVYEIGRAEANMADALRGAGMTAFREADYALRDARLPADRDRLDNLAYRLVTGAGFQRGLWGGGSLNTPHPTSPVGRTATLGDAILLDASPEYAAERAAGLVKQQAADAREAARAWAADAHTYGTRRSFLD